MKKSGLHMETSYEQAALNHTVYDILESYDETACVISLTDFTIVYANRKLKEIFGSNIIGKACYDVFFHRELACYNCPLGLIKESETRHVKLPLDMPGLHCEVKITNIHWIDGQRMALCVVKNTQEIIAAFHQQGQRGLTWPSFSNAQLQDMQERLRLSGELYETVVEQIKTIVFEYNYTTKEAYVSNLFQDSFGISTFETINFLESDLTKGLVYHEDVALYHALFENKDANFAETNCRFVKENGEPRWYNVSLQYMRDADGNPMRIIGTMKDIDDVTKSSEALKYRAEYDTLTGIRNSQRFFVDVEYMFEKNPTQKYAIVVFDVDRFKMINDLFDLKTGDEVLIHIAEVLRETMPPDSCYCRMHSDVFGLCLPFQKKGHIIRSIEKIRKGIYNRGFAFDVNTSYGICIPEDRNTPINLLCDRAGLARKTVKGNVMQFCAFYDEQYRDEMLKVREIEHDMDAALKSNQFVMYLQPKYDLKDNKIIGAEVLARWQHPIKGLIQPGDFVPLFERNGFILKLDEFMWEEACKALRSWIDAGKTPVPLSVNISRYHIYHNDLEGILTKLLKKYRLSPELLILEITETLFFDKVEDLYRILYRLQELGFHLEVDDFGSGYSSLNMLRNIPVDTIKIDKDFLDDTLTSDKGKIVVCHTIAMAKELKLGVIAEGVETMEHVEFLKKSNCDIAQGYYFAKPMSLEKFNTLIF